MAFGQEREKDVRLQTAENGQNPGVRIWGKFYPLNLVISPAYKEVIERALEGVGHPITGPDSVLTQAYAYEAGWRAEEAMKAKEDIRSELEAYYPGAYTERFQEIFDDDTNPLGFVQWHIDMQRRANSQGVWVGSVQVTAANYINEVAFSDVAYSEEQGFGITAPKKAAWYKRIEDNVKAFGRGVDDLVHGDTASAKEEFSKSGDIGKTAGQVLAGVGDVAKETWDVVGPVVAPTVYVAREGILEGVEGLEDSLLKVVSASILTNQNILKDGLKIFSAQGKGDMFTSLMKDIANNPKKLIQNILGSGGDVKEGFKKTLALFSGGNYSIANLVDGISGIDNLGNISDLVGSFGTDIGDIAQIWALYETLTEKPIEIPALPELKYMDDETIQNMYNVYSSQIDEQAKKDIEAARAAQAERGIRGSALSQSESDIASSASEAKANYQSNLSLQQLQYNNSLAQQQYALELQNRQLLQQAQQSKMDALITLAAGLFNKDASMAGDINNTVSDILSVFGINMSSQDQSNLVNTVGSGGVDLDVGDLTLDYFQPEDTSGSGDLTVDQSLLDYGNSAPERPNTSVNTGNLAHMNSLNRQFYDAWINRDVIRS